MIRKFFDRVLDVLYPVRAQCLGCGDDQGCDGPFLCEVCVRMMRPVNIIARRDEWTEQGLEYAAFSFYYERPVKGLIRSFKFKHVRILSDLLAQSLIDTAERRDIGPFDMVIPVPLHPSRKRERGYNQSELLARPLAEACGAELRTDVLVRKKNTRQQSKLRVEKRGENLKSAFSAAQDLSGKRILLVDDVVTTGSTLCACAEALREAGAENIAAIALAGSRSWRRGRRKTYRSKKK